jgi:hypothetical protein
MSIPLRSSIILLTLLSISAAARGQTDDDSQDESFMDDVRFVAGASFGYTGYAFPAKLDHDLGFPSGGLTLAATRNRWQLGLTGSFSLKDADVSEEEDVGEASRYDYDLTLGYQINSNWSAFVGYKSGETEITYISREDLDEGNPISLTERYTQDGPYVGGAYSWQFENAGRLTVSLAYAMLDATDEFRANTDDDEPDDEPDFDDLTGRVKGDTTGLSYGLTWTMPLSGDLLFQTRFKMNDYQQDITFEGNRYDNIDETYVSLLVGLAYVF